MYLVFIKKYFISVKEYTVHYFKKIHLVIFLFFSINFVIFNFLTTFYLIASVWTVHDVYKIPLLNFYNTGFQTNVPININHIGGVSAAYYISNNTAVKFYKWCVPFVLVTNLTILVFAFTCNSFILQVFEFPPVFRLQTKYKIDFLFKNHLHSLGRWRPLNRLWKKRPNLDIIRDYKVFAKYHILWVGFSSAIMCYSAIFVIIDAGLDIANKNIDIANSHYQIYHGINSSILIALGGLAFLAYFFIKKFRREVKLINTYYAHISEVNKLRSLYYTFIDIKKKIRFRPKAVRGRPRIGTIIYWWYSGRFWWFIHVLGSLSL